MQCEEDCNITAVFHIERHITSDITVTWDVCLDHARKLVLKYMENKLSFSVFTTVEE